MRKGPWKLAKPARFSKRPKGRGWGIPRPGILTFAAVLSLALAAINFDAISSSLKDLVVALGFVPGCNIKGNIRINTGERIYHVPGQKYYQATRIDVFKGERWFCSEAEARQGGWRKALR